MSVPSIQPSFSAGEIAPALYGRVDLAKYHVAATTLRNCFVSYRGGAYSRAGMRYVLRAKQAWSLTSSPPRAIPYQFSLTQGYALEFGDHYMRVHFQGAPVSESPLAITNITQANPAVVTVSVSGALTATANISGVTRSYAPADQVTLAGGVGPTPAVLSVTNTEIFGLFASNAGVGVYAPADTIHLTGGTQTTPAVLSVVTTFVTAAAIASAGSGGTNGSQTVTGTTGTGTKFQAKVTVTGGAIASVDLILVSGLYSVNPTNPAAEPVTGAGLTGATLNLSLGVAGFAISNAGVFTANPPGGTFTQASTSGSGTGAAFAGAIMAPHAMGVVTPGVYSTFPTNPVSQASTTGSGLGATYNLTSSTSAGFNDGDWVTAADVSGMTEVNGNTYIVAGSSGATFQLHDLNGNPVDSTGFNAYTGNGQAARIFTLAMPYAASDLPLLKYTQSADVMTFTHPSYPPYDLARISATNWTMTQSTFGTTVSAPSSVSIVATVTPNPSSSPPTLPAAYAQVVTAVDAKGQESIASPVGNVTDSVDISVTAGSLVTTWIPVQGAVTYNIYQAQTSYNTKTGDTGNALPVPPGALFGYIGTSYGASFVNSNITPDFTQVPPLHENPLAPGKILAVPITSTGTGYTTAAIAITTSTGSGFVGVPVFNSGALVAIIVQNGGANYAATDTVTITGDGTGAAAVLSVGPQTGTYPSVVAYFQQRRVYAGSLNQPDTYWMSQPGQFLNFDSRVPVSDSDAITGTPWSQQVNGIQWMIPMPGGLVVLTGLGAWQVTGAGGSALNPVAITPSSQQAQPQTFNGASQIVPPFVVNYDIIYVQAKGAIVRDLGYTIWLNNYTGNDLTLISGQLFSDFTLLDAAWCEEPYKIGWFVRSDGAALSLTYEKAQELYGWARHDTNGKFLSVCSVTEPPVDALYIVTERYPTTGGAYYIERMDDRLWSTIENCWCVDAGLSYPMPAPNAVLSITGTTGFVTLIASAPVFSRANVGDVVRAGGAILTITGFATTTQVSAQVVTPFTALIPGAVPAAVYSQPAGSWTMTHPTTVVIGLSHLVGLTVTGTADGVAIPPQVVGADGTVTLDAPATAITVGLPFQAQAQSTDLDGGSPTIQGRRKTVTGVTVRVEASKGLKVGTNQPDGAAQSPPLLAPPWTGLMIDPDLGTTYTTPGGQTAQNLYTGDLRTNVGANWAKPGQVAVQQDNPFPMNITAFIPETLEGDTPEEGYAPQQLARDPRQTPRGPGLWMLS